MGDGARSSVNIDKGDVSFAEMLATHSFFEYFRQFVCSEYSEQNILFYSACKSFKEKAPKLSKSELLAAAQKLATLYIGDDALLQVNLSKDECLGVLSAIEAKDVSENCFDIPQKAILKLMERDSWKRFEKTSTYKTLRLLRETPKILKPKTAEQQAAVRQSSILVKSFQIVTNVALNQSSGFLEDFYQKFFLVSPEASALLSKRPAHQVKAFRGALEQLLAFMQSADSEKFLVKVQDLARLHLSMGITSSMFYSLGRALIDTLRVYLLLDEGSPEWDIIERHWTVAFDCISQQIMKSMRALVMEKGLFKKSFEPPSWLVPQLAEYNQYVSLTLIQLGKVNKATFQEDFYRNFFGFSPMSKVRFSSPTTQATALFGAIEAVGKLLGKPKKMSKFLESIARTHRDLGVTTREYMVFVRALRVTFRKTLGADYNERIDTVWKQYLELVVMFADGGEVLKRGDMSASWTEIWEYTEKKDEGNAKAVWNALHELSDSYSTTRDSTCSESDSINSLMARDEPEITLDIEFFSKQLPQLSLEQIATEIEHLNDQLIYCTSQLRLFKMQEVQSFCLPATAALLAPYTKDGKERSSTTYSARGSIRA